MREGAIEEEQRERQRDREREREREIERESTCVWIGSGGALLLVLVSRTCLLGTARGFFAGVGGVHRLGSNHFFQVENC